MARHNGQTQQNFVFHQGNHIEPRIGDKSIHQGIFRFPERQFGFVPGDGQHIPQFVPFPIQLKTTLTGQPYMTAGLQPQNRSARLRSTRKSVLHRNII